MYQVARCTSPGFTDSCMLVRTPSLSWMDLDVPDPAGAYYYLVRSVSPYIGSWGSGEAERWPDVTCGERTEAITFQDTYGDDIPETALYDYFDGTTVASTDYILFDIQQPWFNSWCAERADFYRDSYLSLAPTGGYVSSGLWDKWHRNYQTGYAWAGPVGSTHGNCYGGACAGREHAWGSEIGLGGLPARVVDPKLPWPPGYAANCEIYDASLTGCGDGTWWLTIRIGSSRQEACGF